MAVVARESFDDLRALHKGLFALVEMTESDGTYGVTYTLEPPDGTLLEAVIGLYRRKWNMGETATIFESVQRRLARKSESGNKEEIAAMYNYMCAIIRMMCAGVPAVMCCSPDELPEQELDLSRAKSKADERIIEIMSRIRR